MTKQMMENDEDDGMVIDNAFVNIPVARQHTFYISGPILGPEHYAKWFHIMRHTSKDDVVIFHINSTGEDAASAIQFMRAMADCAATVVASVEGNCMSAATLIFLSADVFQVSEHSMFMFHNYSGLSIGKGNEMFDSISHERKWSRKLLQQSYEDFLSPAEIDSILDGKDIWMDADEAIERLNARAEASKAKRKADKKANKNKRKAETEDVD